jgi:DHA2 family multidrug resistance protein
MVDFSTLDRFQDIGEAAMRMVDAEVNRQAAMIAYLDNFYLMMWMTILTVPLVGFMRRANLRRIG